MVEETVRETVGAVVAAVSHVKASSVGTHFTHLVFVFVGIETTALATVEIVVQWTTTYSLIT
jgi:hypothetical protein